jgi:putative glycosyltransferase
MVKLSIVTTMYRSGPYLREFYKRAKAEASRFTDDHEIIFVNDGSPDDSLAIAIALHHEDPSVQVVDLSRNFGHHKAMMTGLSFATGDLVFLIDCDLEENPELLGTFHEVMQTNPDADVVFGVLARRKGGWFERFSGWLFFKIINLLWAEPLPANLVTARLMTQRYVQALNQYRESELVIAGAMAVCWLSPDSRNGHEAK